MNDAGAAQRSYASTHGASWGLMANEVNQTYPFRFEGARDDPVVYAKLKELTSMRSEAGVRAGRLFPSAGIPGRLAQARRPGFDPDDRGDGPGQAGEAARLAARLGSARVRRGGHPSRLHRAGRGAAQQLRLEYGRVASCSKAICATVLAIASEESRQGRLPRKMTFEDHAFDFIPWAWPLSDPRKAKITVKQLLNHTSGI